MCWDLQSYIQFLTGSFEYFAFKGGQNYFLELDVRPIQGSSTFHPLRGGDLFFIANYKHCTPPGWTQVERFSDNRMSKLQTTNGSWWDSANSCINFNVTEY